MFGVLLSIYLIVGAGNESYAAAIDVSARADRQVVSVGETVNYEITVVIEGSGALTLHPEPTLPTLSGLTVVGTSTRQDLRMGSGGTRVARSFIYILRATAAGSYTIKPATVELGGRTYQSNSVQVNVTPGAGPFTAPSAPAPPSPPETSAASPQLDTDQYIPTEPVSLVLSAEPENPYVGQQVILSFTLYQSHSLYGDPSYEPPKAGGFVTKELPHADSTTRLLGGTEYLIQQRRWAAFPTTAGPAHIDPVLLTASTNPMRPPTNFKSNSLDLNVRQLPPAPAGKQFEGAVGHFSADLRADRNSVKAGETFSLTLTISGTGNLHALGAPQPQVPEWVSIYRSREDRTSAPGYGGRPDDVGGEARFEFLALAKRKGTLEVPPIEFMYFEPKQGQYRAATTDGVSIAVGAGVEAIEPPTERGEQMRHIIANGPGRVAAEPLLLKPLFWLLQILPVIGVLISAIILHRKRTLAADSGLARSLNAHRVARAHMQQAATAARVGDDAGFCSSVSHAVTDFVAHRTGLEASDIPAQQAIGILRASGQPKDTIARTEELLRRCQAGRFAGTGGTQYDEMLGAAERIISELQAAGLGGH